MAQGPGSNIAACQFCGNRFVRQSQAFPLSTACENCRALILREARSNASDQFYAGFCAALAVVDELIDFGGDGLLEAMLEVAPDLEQLIAAANRRGDYRLAGRIRRFGIARKQQ